MYHLQILSGSWDQHNVTSPYTTVVFESAGSFLAFQAQLNSSWIVLFLGIKYNRKLIWLLKQTPQHPFLFTCLSIKTKNKILHLLHLYSIKLEETIGGLLQKLICKQFRVINWQHVSKIQKHCIYYIILCKWLVCLLTDSYKTEQKALITKQITFSHLIFKPLLMQYDLFVSRGRGKFRH